MRVNLRAKADFEVPSPLRGEGQDEGNGMAKVLLTPLTLALSPVGRGNCPSQKKGNDLKLTPMP
jgi:hypothetical protein